MPKFEREVDIDAPVETVWNVMTNPDYWPEWFPGVGSVSDVTSVSEGGTFKWTLEDREGRGTIVKMEPMKRLEIRTQVGDEKDVHMFRLRTTGVFLGLSQDECKLEYTLDTLMGGGILGRFVAGGNPKDAMQVKKAVHRLRRLVESM